jgi:hypothetical protein
MATHTVRNGQKIAPVIAQAAPLDTVLIENGSYSEDQIVVNKPLTIRGLGDSVFIDGKAGVNGINSGFPSGRLQYAGTTGKSFNFNKLLWITSGDVLVENINVIRSMGRGIMIGQDGGRVKNVMLVNTNVDIARNAGLICYNVDDIVIDSCKVSGAADIISGTAEAKNHAGGLTVKNGKRVLINNCVVSGNWGEGLMIDTNWGESSDWQIMNTDIFNNGWLNLYIHATQNGFVNNVRVWEDAEFNPNKDRRIGAGLGVHINPIEERSYQLGGRVFTNDILIDGLDIANAGVTFGRSLETIPDTLYAPTNLLYQVLTGAQRLVQDSHLLLFSR